MKYKIIGYWEVLIRTIERCCPNGTKFYWPAVQCYCVTYDDGQQTTGIYGAVTGRIDHFSEARVEVTWHLCSALLWKLTFTALRMARVNERSHSFTCHPHVYPQMEWAILPLLPNGSASSHFGRYSFPVPQRAGCWVGLGSWLHIDIICPPEDGHPSLYHPTDSTTAGIELMTGESQVRRPNH